VSFLRSPPVSSTVVLVILRNYDAVEVEGFRLERGWGGGSRIKWAADAGSSRRSQADFVLLSAPFGRIPSYGEVAIDKAAEIYSSAAIAQRLPPGGGESRAWADAGFAGCVSRAGAVSQG
jgi:hypothetical protein